MLTALSVTHSWGSGVGKLCAEGDLFSPRDLHLPPDHIRLQPTSPTSPSVGYDFKAEAMPESSLETQNLGLRPDILNENLHFNEIPTHTVKFEKHCVALSKATQTTALSVLTWQGNREEGNVFRAILHTRKRDLEKLNHLS